MNLNLTTKNIEVDIQIVLVKNKKIKQNKDILETLNFKGEDEQTALLPELGKLYVGCETDDKDNIRVAVAAAIKVLNKTNFKSASIRCKDSLDAYIDGFELGNYRFDKYKSKKEELSTDKNIYIVVNSIDKKIQNIEILNANQANQLMTQLSNPPLFLTQEHKEYLAVLVKNIDEHLNKLSVDWLVEKFKALSQDRKLEFLERIKVSVK